jgi:hypothetical protein
MSSAATEGRFQERAKEHDVRTGNIIAAKGMYETNKITLDPYIIVTKFRW